MTIIRSRFGMPLQRGISVHSDGMRPRAFAHADRAYDHALRTGASLTEASRVARHALFGAHTICTMTPDDDVPDIRRAVVAQAPAVAEGASPAHEARDAFAFLVAPGADAEPITGVAALDLCLQDLAAASNPGMAAEIVGDYLRLPEASAAPVPLAEVTNSPLPVAMARVVERVLHSGTLDAEYEFIVALCRVVLVKGAAVPILLPDGSQTTFGAYLLLSALASLPDECLPVRQLELLMREVLAGIGTTERDALLEQFWRMRNDVARPVRETVLRFKAAAETDVLPAAEQIVVMDHGEHQREVLCALGTLRAAAQADVIGDLGALRAAVKVVAAYADVTARVVLMTLRARVPPRGHYWSASRRLRRAIDAAVVAVEARNPALVKQRGDAVARTAPAAGQLTGPQQPQVRALPLHLTPPTGMVYLPGGTLALNDNRGRHLQDVPVPPLFMDAMCVTHDDFHTFSRDHHGAPWGIFVVSPTGRLTCHQLGLQSADAARAALNRLEFEAGWRGIVRRTVPQNYDYDSPRRLQPAVDVSVYEAAAYLMTQKKRLPTQAEWAHAATCGGECPLGVPGGARTFEYVDSTAGVGGSPKNVNEKLPSPWGLYGMLGGVRQWTDRVSGESAHAAGFPWDTRDWSTHGLFAAAVFVDTEVAPARMNSIGFRGVQDVEAPTPQASNPVRVDVGRLDM